VTMLLDAPKKFDFNFGHSTSDESYTFIRDGKPFLAIPKGGNKLDGYDSVRVRRHVRGGATASTPQSAAQQAAQVLRNYLQVAPEKNYAITGTVPTGSAGGSNSFVTFVQPIPIIPAFCDAIDYEVTLPVTVALNAGTCYLSPFAPYCAFSSQMTLGGAPPWPMTELTPWHIDETTHRIDYDPAYFGLGNQSVAAFAGAGLVPVLDAGPQIVNIGVTGSLAPGTAAGSTNYTWQFTVRQILKRKRHLLWGAVPFGDPENRPNHLVQLNALVGTNPEQNLFVVGTAGPTCVLNGAATVKVIYRLGYIDLLPPSMQQAPTPAVTYGLQLVVASPTGLAAGSIFTMTHRTAMIYTAMHHIVVNNKLATTGPQPLETDYFALWDDQDAQSARYTYDASANTFNEYFTIYKRNYRRYPYLGVYSVEMDDGEFPEVPSVTPYQGLMSPDASYAAAFNVPVTPAMTTAVRIPTGTTIIGVPYVRTYEFGLVRVPY